MIPLQIPDYRIVRKLGSGAMGTVYEAEHLKLARRVAIKVVRPEHARAPELEARFVNEARALARVRHPSIVLIFEFGVLPDGTAYLVMEYLPGESLEARWQRRQRTATPLTELRLVHQLTQALALLHSKGVVHRDLKPANVMIVTEPAQPPQERAKLVDFGLAKLIRLSGSKTASSLIMGTPEYMSPEQCRGAGQVGAKTDCYALGVMLYELIAGILPFESAWAGDLIGMHIHVEPPPLVKLEPNVDPRLASLIHALLRKDQTRRPEMGDVARYLDALIDQLSQNLQHPLPSLEPKVDPFEETRVPGAVVPDAAVPDAPVVPPGVVSLAPVGPPAERRARKPALRSRPSQAATLGGILFLSVSSWLIFFGKNRNGIDPKNINSDYISSLNYLPLDDRVSSLSPQDLGGQSQRDSSVQELNSKSAKKEENSEVSAVNEPANARPVSTVIFERKLISHPQPTLPEEVARRVPCRTITGTYQLCLHPEGSVDSVQPIVSIPGADRAIMQTLAEWRYEPHRVEQCLPVYISFQVGSEFGTCRNYSQEALGAVSVPLDWLPETVGREHPAPSWPDAPDSSARCKTKKLSYKIYVDKSGTVKDVVPMGKPVNRLQTVNKKAVEALTQLRYEPLAFPIYLIRTFTLQGANELRECRAR